jgi:cytochrome c oxidase subunit 4
MSEHAASHDSHGLHTGHAAQHGDDHAEHGGIGKYLVVFLLLCLLTMASFLTYFPFWRSHIPMEASRALMMAVSCSKAMLVAMFFMHLKWEANWKWVLTVPATFMSVFLLLMLVPDVGLRQDTGFAGYSYERRVFAADPPAAHGDGHAAGNEHGDPKHSP